MRYAIACVLVVILSGAVVAFEQPRSSISIIGEMQGRAIEGGVSGCPTYCTGLQACGLLSCGTGIVDCSSIPVYTTSCSTYQCSLGNVGVASNQCIACGTTKCYGAPNSVLGAQIPCMVSTVGLGGL